jgi:hypothetical protein
LGAVWAAATKAQKPAAVTAANNIEAERNAGWIIVFSLALLLPYLHCLLAWIAHGDTARVLSMRRCKGIACSHPTFREKVGLSQPNFQTATHSSAGRLFCGAGRAVIFYLPFPFLL